MKFVLGIWNTCTSTCHMGRYDSHVCAVLEWRRKWNETQDLRWSEFSGGHRFLICYGPDWGGGCSLIVRPPQGLGWDGCRLISNWGLSSGSEIWGCRWFVTFRIGLIWVGHWWGSSSGTELRVYIYCSFLCQICQTYVTWRRNDTCGKRVTQLIFYTIHVMFPKISHCLIVIWLIVFCI